MTPESIQQLLNSENFGDRIQGLNQVRQLEAKTAFDLLQPLVDDPNPRVRYAAISQFDSFGHVNLERSLELLRDRTPFKASYNICINSSSKPCIN